MDCNLQTTTTWNGLSGKKWGLTNENKKRTIRIINPGIVVIPILVLLHLIQTGAIDTISKKTSVKTNKIRENPSYWYKYGKFSILVTGVILALFFIPVVNAQAPTAAFSGTPTTGILRLPSPSRISRPTAPPAGPGISATRITRHHGRS